MPTKPSSKTKSKSTAAKKRIGEDKPERDDRAAPAKKRIGEDKPERDDRSVAAKKAPAKTKKPKSAPASDERTYTPAPKKKR